MIEKELKNAIARNARRREKAVREGRGSAYYLQYDEQIQFLVESAMYNIKRLRHITRKIKEIEKKYKKQEQLDNPPKDKLAGRNRGMPNTL